MLYKSLPSVVTAFPKIGNRAKSSTYAEKKALYGSLFPDRLLNRKQKTPQAMYLANEDGAKLIMNAIDPHLKNVKYDTVLEFNPGIGLLTRRLLVQDKIFRKFILVESIDYFMQGLLELEPFYGDKVVLQYGDVVNLWKLNHQDKHDNGTRVADTLKEVPRKEHDDGKEC